jgi:beta-ureidopropionase / N-carbamoyl-L-amino-acid hydrolase
VVDARVQSGAAADGVGDSAALAPVNEARCWDWLMRLGEITDPARPWTRTAFSERHLQGRQFLTGVMRELGLEARIDVAGNLIGRREGTDPAAGTIMIGSHSDTVVGGGRFDGIAGVIAGLEIAAALGDTGVRLRHGLEIVDFLAEEPNEFGLSCIGSRGMAGALDTDMLARVNRSGASLREAIAGVRAAGPSPDETSVGAARRGDLAAFFELHIEQGPVLEAQGSEVGVVTHIAGIRRLALTFKGQAAHAGTTPLDLRRDALVAASRFVLGLRGALESVRLGSPFVIATVGEVHVTPNAPNVVPGEARVVVDLRSDSSDALVSWTERIRALGDQAVADTKVQLADFKLLSATQPTTCAPSLLEHLRAAAGELSLKQQDIVSGAGHDAAFLSQVAPAAMLFVPSREGMSHCAQEWTDSHALAKGVATVLRAVRAFDSEV